jgi:RNA polymerase sigma-70 factor (ECF subfamily)
LKAVSATNWKHSEGVSLIRRMAAADRQAFTAFYDAYSSLVFTLVRRLLGNPTDAEDVLQEVFWQSWREAGTYDEGRGSPEAWLLNRARSRAIDRLRSMRRRSETSLSPEGEGSGTALRDEATKPGQETEDRVAARSALAILPGPQRQVIELAYFGGYTQE